MDVIRLCVDLVYVYVYVCVHRLNSCDVEGEPVYIQMVSALVLQLIQCVVHLPSERDSEEDHKKVSHIHYTTIIHLLSLNTEHKTNEIILSALHMSNVSGFELELFKMCEIHCLVFQLV